MRLADLLAPPLCASCGRSAGRAEPLCPSCRGELRFLGSAGVDLGGLALWAPVAYEGPARALVRALKFSSALPVADTMAAQITANAPPGLLDGVALVPVPAHPARRRRRGFDQAAVLATRLSERSGAPLARCLARSGSAVSQVGRGRAERVAGIAGAIACVGEPPADALLVDDVATTGATLSACAAALRWAGAERVGAIAYARTPGR